MMPSAACFTLKNFELQCSKVLPEAELVYQTYGELADDRSNVILYPTSYGAQHSDIEKNFTTKSVTIL
jgi:homoserine O-acetyltransferase